MSDINPSVECMRTAHLTVRVGKLVRCLRCQTIIYREKKDALSTIKKDRNKAPERSGKV